MAEQNPLRRDSLEDYKCCANSAIQFKLVRQEADLRDEQTTFRPDMTHQIFGDQESVFGFKGLQIQLFFTSGHLAPYLDISYTDRIPESGMDGVFVDNISESLLPHMFTVRRTTSADNISESLLPHMPPNVLTNIDDFLASVDNDIHFRPVGELLHCYQVSSDGLPQEFRVYKTDIDVVGFREFHDRLQTFVIFFIDAASFIDVDDPKWRFYTVYERYICDGDVRYATVGYMTTYNYYAYPTNIRPRLSQFLILPPFQRQGHGRQLLQTFYNDVVPDPSVMDIAVEDPSEEFQRLRDFVDSSNCLTLPTFQPHCLQDVFTAGMADEARLKLKLCKRQARQVYEILRLRSSDMGDDATFRAYRLEVKKRLNIPFHKSKLQFQKLEKALDQEELAQTLSCWSMERRYGHLHTLFEEHLEYCQRIIQRLDRHH